MQCLPLFRPPWGSFLFLLNITVRSVQKYCNGFRPLWESFLFLLSPDKVIKLWCEVSVPYGDLFYFYPITRKVHLGNYGFPSPMGIFFVSIGEDAFNKTIQFAFPSPMGIFFISIATLTLPIKNCFHCFRPLWGSFYFYILTEET